MKPNIAKAVSALAALLISYGSATAAPKSFTPHRVTDVLTYNVYLGTDLTPIFTAIDQTALFAAVGEAWLEVQASNIPSRAAVIADEIASASPALVGLQEVVRWSTGPTPEASDLQFDFLDLILARLAADGVHYAPVAVQDNLDASAPTLDQNFNLLFVRLLDRDVMLARTDLRVADLKISNLQQQTFSTVLSFSTPVLGSITIPRGWISTDAKVRGKTFRFITTHLEGFNPLVQVAQASELIEGPANTSMPVVMTGDFNSDANRGGGPDTTATYPEMIAAGFQDAWSLANPGIAGNTCCQAEKLDNSVSQLYERIDLIMIRSGVGSAMADLSDVEAGAAPFWASDHAALKATLQIPTRASR